MGRTCYLCGGMMVKKVGQSVGTSGRRGYYYKCTKCGRNHVPQE